MKTIGNDRYKAKSLSLSYFFSRLRKRYNIIENEYGAGIPVMSETKLFDRKHESTLTTVENLESIISKRQIHQTLAHDISHLT